MNSLAQRPHARPAVAAAALLSSLLMTSAVASAAPGSPALDVLPAETAPLPAPPPPSPPSAPAACCASPSAPPESPPPERPHAYPPPFSDRPQHAPQASDRVVDERLLHGFRLGYGYVADFDKPVKSLGGQSLADRTNMRSPHNFLIGYEAFYRMAGHSWLNVILTANVIVAGLEQSQFYPTGNTLLGFEFKNSFQVGVGANLAPLKDSVAHTIFAAGWTPRVGNFYTPVHAFFIPDVDGVHRMGVLTGVTW